MDRKIPWAFQRKEKLNCLILNSIRERIRTIVIVHNKLTEPNALLSSNWNDV